MQEHLANIFRMSVVVSVAVIFIGGILFLSRHGGEVRDYTNFYGAPRQLRDVRPIVYGVFHNHSRSIIQFGILLLIATPIIRIACCGVMFIRQRDWFYLGVVLFILSVLFYSLFYTSYAGYTR